VQKLPECRVKGRPHYYSTKKEEYAVIRFSLDANLTSLFTWNTKQLFVYVTAEWPSPSAENATDSAVIWDTIITSPRADHLQNIGPVAMRKLKASAKGKALDADRYVPSYTHWLGIRPRRSRKGKQSCVSCVCVN
jgi:signal peptidase complex subunit 3